MRRLSMSVGSASERASVCSKARLSDYCDKIVWFYIWRAG